MQLRSLTGLAVALFLTIGLAQAQTPKLVPVGPPADNAAAPSTLKQRASYAIGVDLGSNLRSEMQQRKFEVDPHAVAKGLVDALAGDKLQMTDKELQATMLEFQKAMQVRHQEAMAKMAKLGEIAKKEGPLFLAENKKKEGVKTLASGLQYKVLKEGKGASPKATDIVTTHYRGTLLDGTEFDSSYRRNEPAEFPVNQVIPGWTEALQLMKVGDKWQLFVPADLAYAERGAGEDIPPNSTLIFEIELLGVRPAHPAGAGATLPVPNE